LVVLVMKSGKGASRQAERIQRCTVLFAGTVRAMEAAERRTVRARSGARASLKDVARLAGVSPKTVSNVIHGYVHITQETRSRVQQALDELNYRPNLSARHLRAGRSGVIALAVPELGIPYFAELGDCVIRAAEGHGWTVLIDQTDGLAEREQLVTAGIRDQLIDGLILSPLAMGHQDLQRRVDDTPLVLLGERVHGGPADHVAIDNVAAARAATAHLLEIGRRRIAAIGDQRDVGPGTARLRLAGFAQALRNAGLPLDQRLVMPAPSYHRQHGAEAMTRLLDLDEPPDAVFCFNDLMAFGAIRTILSCGLRVPGDVAVVGFDDIEEGRFSTPTLTTIRPDKEQIARLAVSLLHERLGSGRDQPPRELQADFSLMVRESTTGGG
jgi:DNA-binding LacI/PurR family transcriptional regulator